MSWIRDAFTTERGQERRADRRAERKVPEAPGASQLYSGPQAQWGGYDPNTGTMTRPAGTGGLSSPRGPGAFRSDLPSGPGGRFGQPAAGRSTGAAQYSGTPQSPLAMAQVRGDEQGMQAAREALTTLQQVGREGWTPVDRLALAAAQRQAARGEQAQRGALMQQSAARGLGGSALGFGSALAAQQGSADRANDYASQMAIAGRDRALGATQASANLGMGIDDTAFSQAQQRAAAVDAANQWFTGRQDDAAAQAYQAQLGAWQMGQEQRQQRLQSIMGGVGGLFNMGTGIAGLVKGGQ